MVIALETSTQSFKPNLRSHHIDESGFIIVEDPRVVRDHEHEEWASNLAHATRYRLAGDMLSYSGATKMNLTKDDHGVRVGLTENHLNETSTVSDPQEGQHHHPSQPATVSSEGSFFVSQDSIQDNEQPPPHQQRQSHGLLDSSEHTTAAAATTTISLDYGHGLFQGVNNKGAKNAKSSLESSTKECAIDEQGLPVVDVRRDSGFDLLT